MKYKQIAFYAFRDNKGATGGPGGVLYLQQRFLGTKYHNVKLRYVFRTKNKLFRYFFKDFYIGAFVQVFIKELFRFKNYYICNDIGSAYALARLGKSYSLIYHQQGPIVEELTNFGAHLSERQKRHLARIERIAFKTAKSVHFPSSGAEQMFFESSFCSCPRADVNVGLVLPNTIEILPCESTIKNNVLTFLSVGTLTSAKGQDQTIDFVECFLKKYKKPVKYIVVGNGPMREQLLKRYYDLKKKNKLFDFTYYDYLPHDKIIQLAHQCDVYIMLHRISIFDLATLEAMSQSCAIVLSDVGGNKDFNVCNNVLLVNPNNYDDAVLSLSNADIDKLKKLNKDVFVKHFSPNVFKDNLHKLMDGIEHV